MSFKKPFRAQPVKLGPDWQAEQEKAGRRQFVRLIRLGGLGAFVIFLAGMVITNWSVVRSKFPTYYPNCAWARSAGAAPIRRGSPGYRSGLDADEDGIACEPYWAIEGGREIFLT